MAIEALVSQSGAARLLGLSREWIRQLVKEAERVRGDGAATELTFPEPFGLVEDDVRRDVRVWRKADLVAWGERRKQAAGTPS